MSKLFFSLFWGEIVLLNIIYTVRANLIKKIYKLKQLINF